MAGGGGGGAPAPKADEPQPHPPKDQLPNVSYCMTSPPPWREFHSISILFNFESDSYGIFKSMFCGGSNFTLFL